jgi:hypothetical protein
MPTSYLESEIEIQAPSGDTYPFSFSAPGGDARGTLRLPTSDPAFQTLLGRLAALDTDEAMLTQLGRLLFESLFQGKVKEVYNRTQGQLQNAGLRLKLKIDADEAHVAALPWEFLNDPDQGPLALLDLSIVRYLPQQAVIPHLKAVLPLNMLLTGAQPKDLETANIERELDDVQKALAPLVASGQIAITVEPHLTRGVLQERLQQGFHIWHFAGHGGFDSDGVTSRLFAEDDEASADGISAQELKIYLRGSSVRLILLDACESARLATDPFHSLAPALINAMVPAVIAMQFKFGQKSARAFAGWFYRALSKGLPIDACVNEGRKGIMGVSGLRNPDWGIPVVYTRAPDGQLFDLPATSATASTATPSAAAQGGININLSGARLDNSSVGINNIGNTITSDNAPSGASPSAQASDNADEQILALEQQVEMYRRQLNQLELKKARQGIDADVSTILDIEDSERAQIATMDRIIAIRSERVDRLQQAANATDRSVLDEARRALLSDTLRRQKMELRVLERKALDFGPGRTPYDERIASTQSQIEETSRRLRELGG